MLKKKFRLAALALGIMLAVGSFVNIPLVNTTGVAQAASYTQYTVRYGDSLYYIAQDYGISIAALKSANGLSSNYIVVGQVLKIPTTTQVNFQKPLVQILHEKGITNPWATIVIKVDKTDHVLSLFSNGTFLKSYHAELGDNGLGDKQVAGDHKTPEGTLYIAEKSILTPADPYLGTRWMRLSYPNIEDAQRGLRMNLINWTTYQSIVNAINAGKVPPQRTALGGGVGIHGGSTLSLGKDWTYGCVGLTNKDVEDFYDYVAVGTKVIINY